MRFRVIKAPIEYLIPRNSRVKLKDGFDDVYLPNNIAVGAEGWVRRRSALEGGFPMVYIEWDRDHWTYSDQDDLWTYENHFDVVKDELMGDVDPDLVAAVVAAIQSQGDDVITPVTDEEEEAMTAYLDAAADAHEAAVEGDAFFTLVLHETETDGQRAYVPHMVSHQQSEEAGLYLQAQLCDLVAGLHQGLLVDKIRRVRKG